MAVNLPVLPKCLVLCLLFNHSWNEWLEPNDAVQPFSSATPADESPMPHPGILVARISPDETRLATGGSDRTLRIWDLSNKKQLNEFSNNESVAAIAWSPNSKTVASAGRDREVKLWNLETGKLVATLVGHKQKILAIRWSEDGTKLSSISQDGAVITWNSGDGRKVGEAQLSPSPTQITGTSWSRDGRKLAVISTDNTLRIWTKHLEAKPITKHFADAEIVSSFAWAPNNSTLVVGTQRGRIHLVDIKNLSKEKVIDGGKADMITQVAWSSDGRSIASGNVRGLVQIWDADTATLRDSTQASGPGVTALGWRDGDRSIYFALAGRRGCISIWKPLLNTPADFDRAKRR
jgi:WD40 repeat protein